MSWSDLAIWAIALAVFAGGVLLARTMGRALVSMRARRQDQLEHRGSVHGSDMILRVSLIAVWAGGAFGSLCLLPAAAWVGTGDREALEIAARLFGVAVYLLSPDQRPSIRRAVQRDAPSHPSPNAGVAEAAMAGALHRQLGGPLRYGDRYEDRPTLGDGQRPRPADIDRAVDLVDTVEKRLVVLLGLVAALGEIGSHRHHRRYRLRRRLF